jgi:hypothetical protein
MSVLDSIDNMLAAADTYGILSRFIIDRIQSATGVATVNCGGISAQRYPAPFTVPTLGTGVTGAYATYCRMHNEDTSTLMMMALDIEMGTLTVNTNAFVAGSDMPTDRPVFGENQTMATMVPMLVVTSNLTATTPTITITYTNQDGVTGQTATLILPTNPVLNSAFMITPHLASGDTGIRAITNMSKSAGTGGILKIFGLVPLAMGNGSTAAAVMTPDILPSPILMPMLKGGDKIAFYRFGSSTTNQLGAAFTLIPETS